MYLSSPGLNVPTCILSYNDLKILAHVAGFLTWMEKIRLILSLLLEMLALGSWVTRGSFDKHHRSDVTGTKDRVSRACNSLLEQALERKIKFGWNWDLLDTFCKCAVNVIHSNSTSLHSDKEIIYLAYKKTRTRAIKRLCIQKSCKTNSPGLALLCRQTWFWESVYSYDFSPRSKWLFRV